MASPGPGNGRLASAVRAVLPSIRADLDRLVRIPSVSADPAAAPHLRASAREVAALLRAAGLHDAEVVAVAGGQPAVLGHRPGPPGAPTVLLYAHHDVQPPGDAAAWDSDPFKPSERDGRLYGRGAADDKAGIAVHLAALRAHAGRLPVGVTVLVEGEEEIGSPTAAGFLAAYAGRVRADVLVLADSINWATGIPSLTTSLRGGANVTVEVRTLRHGVHSGAYGGPVPDALIALCRLLATLHDERGDVAVEGLVRGTADPLGLTEERLRADSGLLDVVHLIGTGGPRIAPQNARAMGRAGERRARRDGRALLRPGRRAGLPRRPHGARRGMGEARRGHRRRRLHRVRHRLRRGLPRCRDPHHRGRGPRYPGARREREPGPGGVRAGVPGRGAAAAPPGPGCLGARIGEPARR